MSSENTKKIELEEKLKDKQFLIINAKTSQYFRKLKKEIKEKYGVIYTYNKIAEKMIKSLDKNKFDEELKRID